MGHVKYWSIWTFSGWRHVKYKCLKMQSKWATPSTGYHQPCPCNVWWEYCEVMSKYCSFMLSALSLSLAQEPKLTSEKDVISNVWLYNIVLVTGCRLPFSETSTTSTWNPDMIWGWKYYQEPNETYMTGLIYLHDCIASLRGFCQILTHPYWPKIMMYLSL